MKHVELLLAYVIYYKKGVMELIIHFVYKTTFMVFDTVDQHQEIALHKSV